MGTAVLSTVAATSARGHAGGLTPAATTHGYATAFAVAAVLLAVGAVAGGLLLPTRAAAAD
ncbi:hypothetical protein [Nocardioides pacificus]